MSVHQGHRQRLRERFLEEGLENFKEHEVLELLLYYCIPRRDTNIIAHNLIDRFDTLAGVLEAPPSELKKVEGMGDGAATFIALLQAAERYYLVNKQDDGKPMTSVEACGRYLIPKFRNLRNESVYLLSLDAKCKMLSCRLVGEGSVNSAAVPIRRIVEMALDAGATSVVLAHNHPSGIALPSGEDVQTTRRLAMALNAVEIALVDHIIVADEDYVSLVQSSMYRPADCELPL
jgi:DNA repair protein RadC